MNTSATCPDGIAILKSLPIEDVEARLVDLQAEQDALRTVLRSLKARDRAKRKRQQKTTGGV